MKSNFPKWLRYCNCAITILFVLVCAVWGWGIIEQKRTEAQIRHYFGLTSYEPLNDTNIQAALLRQFPFGTPRVTVEMSLKERGLGKDGKSYLWETNNILNCSPYDYSDGFWMHRIEVGVYFDQESKVTNINVYSFNYSL